MEVAAKLAFQYWQNKGQPRRSFLTLRNGYHGDTVGSVSLGGIDLFHQTFGPLLFKTHFAPSPYCYRCELGLEPKTCDLACAAEVDRILTDHPSQIAAVFVEPLVQGAGGIIVAPDGYLREIRRITSKHNVLFVADEVAVGFGRTGKMFACQHENVQPDFLCLAKGITAGYLPLAATLVSREIFDVFNATTFYHGHTYTGNALACAAALANLDIFDQQEVLESLQPKINLFAQRLEELIGLPFVGDIRSKGLMAGIELVADPPTKLPFACDRHIGAQVCLATRNHGVVLRSLADVIVLMPPLSIATENIDLLFDALTKALRDSADLMQSAAREASENA